MSAFPGSRRGRQSQSWPATLFEVGVLAGVAVGLLLKVMHSAQHAVAGPACHGSQTTCLAHATTNVAMPYLKDGILGGLIGGAIALTLILLVRHLVSQARSRA